MNVPGQIVGAEGATWMKGQQEAWRFEGEQAIHLADGRSFSNYDEAVAASGPRYVAVVRRQGTAATPQPQPQPAPGGSFQLPAILQGSVSLGGFDVPKIAIAAGLAYFLFVRD